MARAPAGGFPRRWDIMRLLINGPAEEDRGGQGRKAGMVKLRKIQKVDADVVWTRGAVLQRRELGLGI